uniref:NADH-ubiquinone oxidoreductase chain 6 n=1 Tax=Clambus sp. CLA01 TaxID=1205546 RepID=A0A0S2MMZ7_9COLE|nr:NADH deshydrogenase subunit 6 [Clambus sp. CLA01]
MTMLSIMIMLSFIFMFMSHPMSMGSILLIQTILTSIYTIKFSITSWFSYMFFLIMIGGMLVLFIYMTSIASNEKFKFNSLILIFSIIFLTLSLYITYNQPMVMEISNLTQEYSTYYNYNNTNIMKLYNYPNYKISFILMNYLFITLIAIVKITHFNYGPIRQMF